MSVSSSLKEREFEVSKFIDLDKDKTYIYNNLYIDNFDMVIKLPISIHNSEEFVSKEEIRIEKFDLTEYIYLLNY